MLLKPHNLLAEAAEEEAGQGAEAGAAAANAKLSESARETIALARLAPALALPPAPSP